VWIGYDQKKPIGSNATGTTVALPIWTSIMKSWVDRRRQELPAPPEFQRPGNVIVVTTATGPEFFHLRHEPIIKRPN
jgi:membrane carboxypeptidase/penicillin-binding protein